jgi:hypothetical protein
MDHRWRHGWIIGGDSIGGIGGIDVRAKHLHPLIDLASFYNDHVIGRCRFDL